MIERTIAWYHGMKRLRIRWERRDDIHEAFLDLTTCIITYRHVVRPCWELLARTGPEIGCTGRATFVIGQWEDYVACPLNDQRPMELPTRRRVRLARVPRQRATAQ